MKERTNTGSSQDFILQLTQGVRNKNEEAFNRFYELYTDRLFRYLIVIAPLHEETVREALQETMYRVIRYIKPFRDEHILWGWLTRVAKSALFDLLRRKKNVKKLKSLPDEGKVIPLYPQEEEGDEQMISALQTVLSQLPEEERALVEAYYYQGIPHAELAHRMDSTKKGIESKMARIRKKMRGKFLRELSNG